MNDQAKTKAQLINELNKLRSLTSTFKTLKSEHKQSKEALAEKALMLDNILRSATDMAIATTDMDFRITYYNPLAEKFFGYTAEEAIGRTVQEIHTRENVDAKRFDQAIEAVRRTGEYRYSLEQQTDNGVRYLNSRVAGIIDSNKKLVGYALFSRDVSEQKQVAETKEYANRILIEERNMFIAGPVVLFKWKNEKGWPVEYVSTNVKEVFGYTAEDWTSAKVSYAEIIPEEDIDRVANEVTTNCKSEASNFRHEPYQIIRKDGNRIWLDDYTTIIRDKAGKITHFRGYVVDITERKRAEEALHKNEAKYRNLIQQSNDAIYLLYNNKFEIINEKFQEIFGLTLEDVNKPEFNIMNLVAPKSKSFIEERERTFANGQELEPIYEFTAISKNGKEIEVEVSTTYIKYKDGIATQGILHDVTERNHLEQQLRQMQKMESIGTLAGGIAHDFNNLLTVIIGHAEMTLMECSKDHPFHKNISSIYHAGKKAGDLTKQLLAFSRKEIIKPQTVDINILISDFDKMMRRLIGEDISMELNLFQDISPIKAEPSQIEQILINLIVNARDAINQLTELASEKKITVETDQVYLDEFYVSKHVGSQIGLHIIISVSDNGIGMPEETKNKIFEPFFTTKEIGHGTGLGMAMVYGIVKQNHGSIYVYSEQGQGTTIKIYWPSTEEKKTIDVIEKKSKDKLEGNETVLFVEDDKGVCDFACSVLKDLGYNVYQASNGKKALELIKEKDIRFDLLITDLIMPEMSGKELAATYKKLDPEILIIYTSGYTDNHILHSGVLDEGINFIQKPYSVQTFAQKVREVLDKNKY